MTDYGEDLAYIHARGYTGLAEQAAAAIVPMLGPPRGLVMDLGCGSGVTTKALADAGHDVLGVDPSPSMLALAHEAAPEARFVRGSAFEVGLPDCSAIMAVGEVLNYTDRKLGPFFTRAAAALADDGLLVFDLAGPGRVRGGGPVKTWAEAEDWAILVETAEDAHRALLTRRMTTFRLTGGGWRRGEESHLQHLHRPQEVAARLRSLGFRVRIRRGYADERFAPGHFVAIARREPRRTGSRIA